MNELAIAAAAGHDGVDETDEATAPLAARNGRSPAGARAFASEGNTRAMCVNENATDSGNDGREARAEAFVRDVFAIMGQVAEPSLVATTVGKVLRALPPSWR